jgi:hypothetical protein
MGIRHRFYSTEMANQVEEFRRVYLPHHQNNAPLPPNREPQHQEKPNRLKEITNVALTLLAPMPLCPIIFGTMALSLTLFTVTPLAIATPVVAIVISLLAVVAIAAIAFASGYFWGQATTNIARLVERSFHTDANLLDRIKAFALVVIEVAMIGLLYYGSTEMLIHSVSLISVTPINCYCFILISMVVSLIFLTCFGIACCKAHFKSSDYSPFHMTLP